MNAKNPFKKQFQRRIAATLFRIGQKTTNCHNLLHLVPSKQPLRPGPLRRPKRPGRSKSQWILAECSTLSTTPDRSWVWHHEYHVLECRNYWIRLFLVLHLLSDLIGANCIKLHFCFCGNQQQKSVNLILSVLECSKSSQFSRSHFWSGPNYNK